MPDPRQPQPPEIARRFRQATAFLLHWRDKDSGGHGEAEVLTSMETDLDWTGFVCAVAEVAWNMAKCPGTGAAEAYVRAVAADAALDEVTGSTP